MTKEKKKAEAIWTPVGRFSYPYFSAPDTGRQFSDKQYKTDLFIPKAIFAEKGKELQAMMLEVGKATFGEKFSLKDGKYRMPFLDTDKGKSDGGTYEEVFQNSIMLRAKAGKNQSDDNKPPIFFGPRKVKDKWETLSKEEIATIKGGDWGKLSVTVFAYEGSKVVQPGISLGLRAVQFWKSDTGFGQGISKLIETIEELEAEIDSVEEDDVTASEAAESII